MPFGEFSFDFFKRTATFCGSLGKRQIFLANCRLRGFLLVSLNMLVYLLGVLFPLLDMIYKRKSLF